ncbi:MAG TPA: hypothetical protein DIC22_07960 [Chitinophagaceae bacterium]|jgi:hypothetical protein|nr:hypothetical protein [Chitinophagaceae bacterium]
MKSKSSHFVLAAEILTIILFHMVKIRQTEKHPAETALINTGKMTNLHQPAAEIKTGTEYMLVNLVK